MVDQLGEPVLSLVKYGSVVRPLGAESTSLGETGVIMHSMVITLDSSEDQPRSASLVREPRHHAPLAALLELSSGVSIRVNPAQPDRWDEISVREAAPRGLVTDLVGGELTTRLFRALEHGDLGDTAAQPFSWRPTDHWYRWARVAAVDSLDRWLQLPLNRALIDAERAVARADAGRPLSPEAGRPTVLAHAVDLARRTAYGLETYFHRLNGPLPDPLEIGLSRLIEGYVDLSELACDGDELRAVVAAGRRRLADLARGRSQRPVGRSARPAAERLAKVSWTSAIDPRQVPARVVHLSSEPSSREVVARDRLVNGRAVLDVEVPAFDIPDQEGDVEVHERLLARFVDRATGRVEAVLTLTREIRPDAPGKRHAFRTRLPLSRIHPARLRVDVVDAGIDLRPVRDDHDPELLAARRAVIELRDGRALLAQRRLGLVGSCRDTAQETDQDSIADTTGDLLVAELAHAHELAVPPRS